MPQHLCLVSQQPLPNLLPAIEPAIAAERVWLVTSPDMRERATWLADEFDRRSIAHTRIEVADPWDAQALRATLETHLADIPRPLLINTTGGTKVMSLVAYELARAHDLPAVYLRPHDQTLIGLHPAPLQPVVLTRPVELDTLLRVHGYTLPDAPPTRALTAPPALLERLARLASDTPEHVTDLNRLLTQHGSVGWRHGEQPVKLQPVLDAARAAGMLARKGSRETPADSQVRALLTGGWLEDWIEHCLDRVATRRGIAPPRAGFKVSKGGTLNEIDVAIVHRQRLHIIECKTRDGALDDLYRLDDLKGLLGGLNARAMLVSLKAVPTPLARRAEDLGLHLLNGEHIAQAETVIDAWLR